MGWVGQWRAGNRGVGGRGLGAEWDDVSAVGGGGKGKKVGRWEESGMVGE